MTNQSSVSYSYHVRGITRSDCAPYILGIHYARRWPSITYAFGLFRDNELVGVVTYGSPPSATLRKGIAGVEMAEHVLELNRLCLRDNLKNEASRLVGASLRQLPKDKIIVSFADTEQDHKGIVYQACSFTYHGLSAKRTDWKLKGKEHLHGQTVADEFRGQKNRATLMREKYGSDFYLAPRPRKHRYIYITGPAKHRHKLAEKINYTREPYPKSATPDGSMGLVSTTRNKFSPNHLTFNAESEMVMNTQEVLHQQPKTKYINTMQPILDLLTRLVVALELIAAKHGNGAAPVAVTTVEVTETDNAKTADKPKATRTKPAAKEEAPKVDYAALRQECKDTITALVESGRKDGAKKVLAAHGVAKLAELADEKLPDIKLDLAKLEEEDLG